MTVSTVPIWVVDVGGAVFVIIFSLLSLLTAYRLKQQDATNIIWAYLFWVCIAMTVFAVSRSAGHIVKQILILAGQNQIWEEISPLSGAVNTIAFIVVGSVTLFFERTWMIYQQMQKDKNELQLSHNQILYMNQNLETLVAQRTDALAESEYKYRRIFEVSRDIILVTREDGGIIDVNRSGCRFFGIHFEKNSLVPETRLHQFFRKKTDWESLRRTLREKGFVTGRELDMKDGRGDQRRVLLSASMMGAAEGGEKDGDTIHLLIKDIEQQRRMREQIAQADKLASIGELSSGIAHEINNPLGIILGYTQLLLRNEPEDSERRADLKTIEKHAQSCKLIVEDLLNFARQSKTEKTMTDINEVITDVLNFVRRHGRMGQVQIEVALDETLPPLLIDEKKIKQVFINLIMNATHAVDQDGRITIRTRMCRGGNRVMVDVEDNGHGIEPKNLKRVFDPFFTTKPTGEGTGLGLSVSYGIIRNHGGKITVTSEYGKGTVFTIELPVSFTNKENAIDQDNPDC